VQPGTFPVHDLVDLGVELPPGNYATVAGLVLNALGRIPQAPGDSVVIDGWTATVLSVEQRAITRIRLVRRADHAPSDRHQPATAGEEL
jgi:putative hemolysin